MAEENVDAEAVDAVEEPAAAQEEQPDADLGNGAEDAQDEEQAPAEDAAADDAEAAEPEAVEDAQPEAAAEEAEAPAAEEAPKEEEAKEEPKAEEAKAEPAAEEKPKKKGKKKRKKKAASGDSGAAAEAWNRISTKNQEELNWYVMKLAGKVGTTTDLEHVAEGKGGAKELVAFFEGQKKAILFALLQCVTTDASKSVRSKFIYFRFIGSGVKTITKAKMTTYLGKIDDHFPCKHLTMNVSEKCADDMEPTKMATELLRIGGAHKPDKISFGADQEVDVKSL